MLKDSVVLESLSTNMNLQKFCFVKLLGGWDYHKMPGFTDGSTATCINKLPPNRVRQFI